MLIDQYESSYKEMKTKLNRIVALDFNFVIDSKADIDLLNIIRLLILFLKNCISESWVLVPPLPFWRHAKTHTRQSLREFTAKKSWKLPNDIYFGSFRVIIVCYGSLWVILVHYGSFHCLALLVNCWYRILLLMFSIIFKENYFFLRHLV